MAKITKEQVLKFDAACKNGFRLDLNKAVIWNEKACIKDIEIDDSGVLYRFTLEYREVFKQWRKVGVIPILTVDKLIPVYPTGMYTINEMKRLDLGEMIQRKNAKVLQTLTENYTDEIMRDMIREMVVA